MTVDAILTETNGQYDFTLDENGDIATADFFDTSILYSIHGERGPAVVKWRVLN